MGMTLPQSEGGQGGSLIDAVIAIERVAAVCPRSADVVQFGNFGPIRTFAEYGTPAQKARWLGELLAGRMVMSLGMTEPDAGSALTDLKTSARADGRIMSSTAAKYSRRSVPTRRFFWSMCASVLALPASARCSSSAARQDFPSARRRPS